MHLLVIEDERALCETIIVRSLRHQAYSVDCCYDGEKALELLGVEQLRSGAAGSEPAGEGRHDSAAYPAADRRDKGTDPLPPGVRWRTRWRG